MKIQTRLIAAIIPVLIIIFTSTSLVFTGSFRNVLESQARVNANLLCQSYSAQLDSALSQYLNIAQDLGSATITSINIETTLQSFRKRYPQFSQVFYTPSDGLIIDMAPYHADYISYDLSQFTGWQDSVNTRKPQISSTSNIFTEAGLVFFAPAVLSYIMGQEPSVEGIVALVLPLDELFLDFENAPLDKTRSLFVADSKGSIQYSRNLQNPNASHISSLSTGDSLDILTESMIDQKTGFATYSDNGEKKYISFAPVTTAQWSLGINGIYSDMTSVINKTSRINLVLFILGLFIGTLLVYFIVRTVTHPIEELTQLARKITRGDRNIISTVDSSSEVGLLAASINTMLYELRDYQASLEKTVEERTLALQRTNEELEATVEELNASNRTLQNIRENLETHVEERTKELTKAHSYIDNILNSMPSVLIGINPAGIVTQWNREAERKTGFSRTEAIGKSLETLLPYVSEELQKAYRAIRKKESFSISQKLTVRNDINVYEDITVFPLTANGVDGGVIRIDDVTLRVNMEETLRQSQKMEGIGQLTSGIAHDFNNMLAGILGGAELLSPFLDNKEEAKDYISLIIESAEHAAELTQKLLAFSRKGGESFAPVDIHSALSGALIILKSTLNRKVSIKTNLSAESSTIIGDINQLQNAFLNLGINADHAMPDGGLLSVSSKNINLSSRYCDASLFNLTPGAYIAIEIRDTGVGIEEKHLHRIFEPFFTTKEHGKGTGLGLAAVYGTVQQHSGAIEIKSTPGMETVFNLYFPITAQQISPKPLSLTPVEGKGHILVVDDEEVLRISSEAILSDLGYEVTLAENGQSALDIFSENKGIFDLVILDLIMPVMDGPECFQNLKKVAPEIPIIISSGYAKETALKKLQGLELSGFLHKPYKIIELSQIVAQVINDSRLHSTGLR
ncbi:MAG: response regulator [Spirochaetales bacterium]|nr:response regulator [Spirochaetales bacterium]